MSFRSGAGSDLTLNVLTANTLILTNPLNIDLSSIESIGVTGTATINDLIVTGDTSLNTLNVSGDTSLSTLNVDTVYCGGAVIFGDGGLSGSGDASWAGNLNCANVYTGVITGSNITVNNITTQNGTFDNATFDNIAVTGTCNSLQATSLVVSGQSTLDDVSANIMSIINAPAADDNSTLVPTTAWVQQFVQNDTTGAANVVTLDNPQTITGEKTFSAPILSTAAMPATTDSSTTVATTEFVQNTIGSWIQQYQIVPSVYMINGKDPNTATYVPIFANVSNMGYYLLQQGPYTCTTTTGYYPVSTYLFVSNSDDFWIIGPYMKIESFGAPNYESPLWSVTNQSQFPLTIQPPVVNTCQSLQISYEGVMPPTQSS